MKISDFIYLLENIKLEHGDVEVACDVPDSRDFELVILDKYCPLIQKNQGETEELVHGAYYLNINAC